MSIGTAIGVLGGTFDPIHLGHVHLALSMYAGLQLKQIRLIPNAQPLLRGPASATSMQRLAMLRSAIAGHAGLCADEREIVRGGPSYTVDTLSSLRRELGQTPICCIFSMDQFAQFNRWKDWRHILDLAHLVVATRAGYSVKLNPELANLLKERQIQDFRLLHQTGAGHILLQSVIPLLISATQIRAQIHQNNNPAVFLLPEVWEYISNTGLYRDTEK